MTREEQINESVETYMNSLFEDGIEIPIEDYENIEEGFVSGAKWADQHLNLESLWHDASEEPEGTYIVLCDGLDNTQWIISSNYIDTAYANWKDYTEYIDVARWAYIKDILPKEGTE